jgi:phage FluMu protein Com
MRWEDSIMFLIYVLKICPKCKENNVQSKTKHYKLTQAGAHTFYENVGAISKF